MPFLPFVYGYPSSFPRAHCTPNKSVTTLRYTRGPGPVYIQAMPVGTYQVQSPGFPKIVYWHFFCWCSNGSKFGKDGSHCISHFFCNCPHCFSLSQIKPKSFESICNRFFFAWADAAPAYVCAWMLCCFHSLTNAQTFQRMLTASVDSCTKVKSTPCSSATNFGRVWWKVPGGEALSVWQDITLSSQIIKIITGS